VLRLKVGSEINLFDGTGAWAIGEICRVQKRCVFVEVREIRLAGDQPLPKLTIALAPPKGQRQGYLVEKCTELGVSCLWPILTKHSVVKPSTKTSAKWLRRAIEAAKQCGRYYLPTIHPWAEFSHTVKQAGEYDLVVIAHPFYINGIRQDACAPNALHSQPVTSRSCPPLKEGGRRVENRSHSAQPKPYSQILLAHPHCRSILVWIGPEGGWTNEELTAAQNAGAILASLGPNLLRIETAAVAVSAVTALLT